MDFSFEEYLDYVLPSGNERVLSFLRDACETPGVCIAGGSVSSFAFNRVHSAKKPFGDIDFFVFDETSFEAVMNKAIHHFSEEENVIFKRYSYSNIYEVAPPNSPTIQIICYRVKEKTLMRQFGHKTPFYEIKSGLEVVNDFDIDVLCCGFEKKKFFSNSDFDEALAFGDIIKTKILSPMRAIKYASRGFSSPRIIHFCREKNIQKDIISPEMPSWRRDLIPNESNYFRIEPGEKKYNWNDLKNNFSKTLEINESGGCKITFHKKNEKIIFNNISLLLELDFDISDFYHNKKYFHDFRIQSNVWKAISSILGKFEIRDKREPFYMRNPRPGDWLVGISFKKYLESISPEFNSTETILKNNLHFKFKAIGDESLMDLIRYRSYPLPNAKDRYYEGRKKYLMLDHYTMRRRNIDNIENLVTDEDVTHFMTHTILRSFDLPSSSFLLFELWGSKLSRCNEHISDAHAEKVDNFYRKFIAPKIKHPSYRFLVSLDFGRERKNLVLHRNVAVNRRGLSSELKAIEENFSSLGRNARGILFSCTSELLRKKFSEKGEILSFRESV